VWSETPALTGLVLEVDPTVAARYERPGQVVVLRPSARDAVYLAIASSPGEHAAFELLLGAPAMSKIQPADGKAIEIDPPSGKGFPIEMAEGHDVLLFAVGSALAPIRPLVEMIRRRRSAYGKVTLYAGAHTEAHFPYRGEHDAWRRDRIDLVKAISKPYVQDLFRRDPVPVTDAVAYVCGMKDMMDAVSRALVEAGLPSERIGKNW
jgi:NAD(P)H-flavin reductase